MLAGGSGLTIAVSGALVGLFCLLPFYISGGMGAGDVKLIAMCGAFLGPLHAVVASVATLVVGGIIGVAWFFWQFFARGDHYITDDYVTDDGQSASIPSVRHQAKPTSAIPFSLAIVGGVLVTLKAAPTILPFLIGGISS